jgi:hypothetical protein
MLGTLNRFTDSQIPVPAEEVAEVRTFFASWRNELLV